VAGVLWTKKEDEWLLFVYNTMKAENKDTTMYEVSKRCVTCLPLMPQFSPRSSQAILARLRRLLGVKNTTVEGRRKIALSERKKRLLKVARKDPSVSNYALAERFGMRPGDVSTLLKAHDLARDRGYLSKKERRKLEHADADRWGVYIFKKADGVLYVAAHDTRTKLKVAPGTTIAWFELGHNMTSARKKRDRLKKKSKKYLLNLIGERRDRLSG